MSKNFLAPGEKAPESGQYGIYNKNNSLICERTSIKGKTLPPTPKKGQRYRMIDKTKTKIVKKAK